MNCRHCGTHLQLTFVDLASAPPSNAYLTQAALHRPEKWFPLRVLVCEQCWLVQTEDFAGADELFDADYAYFSSYSSSWLAHAERYVTSIVERLHLASHSRVVEVAANDGYLLQFVKDRGISCLGIEPTASTANAARAKGLDIRQEFFSCSVARALIVEDMQADLTVANNVLAHVPDINDFVSGFSLLLKPDGVATFEFPHLLRLVEGTQFDTIYHEHFSYFSLYAVDRIFAHNGLRIFDVEELPTHGGSLRVLAQRADTGSQPVQPSVAVLLNREESAGVSSPSYYADFQIAADGVKNDFLTRLLEEKRRGRKVAAYGAAAKGNTLLNYAGVKSDLITYVVDRNPAKQGKYLPGSRIPIVSESFLRDDRPDLLIILPWNLRPELTEQLDYVREWGCKLYSAGFTATS